MSKLRPVMLQDRLQKRTLHARSQAPRFRRTGVTEYSVRELLRLDVRRSDHLSPFLGFRGDEAAKVGGRARNHCTAQIGEPCLKLGIGEGGVDLVVELVDDLGRRAGGSANAERVAP